MGIKIIYEREQGRVYLITEDNKRHWIPSLEVAYSYGLDLGKAVACSIEEVMSHPRSFTIARRFEQDNLKQELPLSKPVHKGEGRIITPWSRNWFGSQFRGHGLEMSAASSPWPCHMECTVDYADPYEEDEGCKAGFENHDFVPLDYKASLEDMSCILKTDYDFIVCSHVIEHTPRVMLALKNIYEHLAKGGMLVMAVPHMDHTFDRLRKLTPLSHHISDFEAYEREGDLDHIVDYLENAHIKYSGGTADIEQHCRAFLAGSNELDLHYHTFTEDSFAEIIEWFCENVYQWSRYEIFQRYEGEIEFFVRLVK